MIFAIEHIPKHQEVIKKNLLLKTINNGLKNQSLKTMFVNGELKKYGSKTIFKIEPLINFNPFWIAVIWFSIFIILNINSPLFYLGLIPLLLSFAWTKYFWLILIIKSFKKHKVTGKIKLLNDEDLIEFLYSKINTGD